jgi:D-alanyl-D-alanine carboxypeptidase (penicillin-binding protein 5/6)
MKILNKSTSSLLTVFTLLFLFISTASAAVPIPAPPKVAAKNYILVDANSGRVLAEKEADIQVEPASITKLMTSYVIYNEFDAGRLSMDDMVTISEKAWRMGGSRM